MARVLALLSLLLPLLLPLAAEAAAPALGPDDVGTSARIPSVGRTVTYTLRLHAPAAAPLAGEFRVALAANGRPVAETRVALQLAAGARQEVPLRWTPRADGWSTLQFTVTPAGGNKPCARLEQTVPVTYKPLSFVWFGAPKGFAWCNVPTTVKPDDRDWWLWHGTLPCAWKPGVCNKDWAAEQFAQDYKRTPWIAIDEVGAYDDLGQKIIAGVRAHKQAYPEGCRALWYMGVHDYWKELRDCVDLFVPEIYLNYGGNHLGRIDEYVQRTREVGCLDRMIPGLGINVIEDKDKKPTVVPSREDVLRQIRHLKTIAPELSGVGFFHAEAAPGVAEYADELCRTYYLDPVLTLAPGSLQARLQRGKLQLSAVVRNVGGMTARNVTLQFGCGYGGQFRVLATKAVTQLAPEGQATVAAVVAAAAGVESYGVRLVAAAGRTLLNDSLWTVAVAGQWPRDTVYYQAPTEAPGPGLPLFAETGAAPLPVACRATSLGAVPRRVAPAVILPRFPGETRSLATWVPAALPADQPAAFALERAATDRTPLRLQRSGDLLTACGAGYTAVLDLGKDQLTSLKARADSPELLGSPWAFNCTAFSGFGPAEVTETQAGALVTIPFKSPQAEGFSRYFCYAEAPVVRLERYFAPRAELTVTASSEGCAMPQRGGVYAAQRGVGGPVTRGHLNDSKDYRDLLFGYGGAGPGPRNARLAGWFDCAFTSDGGGGLGVAIERRWEAARSDVGYDVTRYYDGGDSLGVMNLWGKALTVSTPQTQVVYLVVHGPLPLDREGVAAPAQQLWQHVHSPAQPAVVAAK